MVSEAFSMVTLTCIFIFYTFNFTSERLITIQSDFEKKWTMTDFHDTTGAPEDRFDIAAIQALIRHLLNQRPFMLGQSLALIYEVEPKYIIRAVNRNSERFPDDFYF